MTTVQDATDTEVRALQRAALLAGADLLAHELPAVVIWIDGKTGLELISSRFDGDVDAGIADLTAWLTHLSISEYSETRQKTSVELTAAGTHLDVSVILRHTVYGLQPPRPAAKVRKVIG